MRYILIFLILFLTGCSSTYQLSSYYSNDQIYGVTKTGDSIRVDVIENEFQFQRKLSWIWPKIHFRKWPQKCPTLTLCSTGQQ